MRLVSGVSCQEFGQIVNSQVIHTTLHWAKKVMVKMWDVDGLVDNQGERHPGLWVIIGNYTTHSLISICFRGAGHSPQRRQVYYSLK
jgi:hypothetical protein